MNCNDMELADLLVEIQNKLNKLETDPNLNIRFINALNEVIARLESDKRDLILLNASLRILYK
jgi:hypothetical protein